VNGIPAADYDGAGVLNDEIHKLRNVRMVGNIALQLHTGDDVYIQYRRFDVDTLVRSCIYFFWSRRGCEYVGRTTRGGSRPASHFDKYRFRCVSRIDVYAATGRRAITALECLARHRFQPIQNRIAPAQRKWTRACPMCRLHADLDDELRALFPLRQR